MDVFLRIDINIAAMVMLGIVSVIAFRRLDRKDPLNQAFLITSVIILLQLFFETTTCILNGRPEPWTGGVSTVLHMGLFGAAPMLTYFWYLMVSRWIVPEEKI
jgi:Ca2+/Na+ antiporter